MDARREMAFLLRALRSVARHGCYTWPPLHGAMAFAWARRDEAFSETLVRTQRI